MHRFFTSVAFVFFVSGILVTSCLSLTANHGTALMRASRDGNVEKVEQLLAGGAKHDERNNSDWTALMFAAQNGHVKVTRLLLDAGANPNLESKSITGNTMAPYPKTTALREALKSGHVALANLLLDRGADVDQTAFAIAAGTGDLVLLQRMLDKGADINKPSPCPYKYHPSAMAVACSKGDLKTVKWLNSKGADLKRTAPLKVTLFGGNADLLKLLLENGADPNLVSGPDDTSPLQHAINLHTARLSYDPDLKLIKILLAHGADKSYAGSTDSHAGKTALQMLKIERDQAAARAADPYYHETRRNDEAAHVKKMDELIRLLEV